MPTISRFYGIVIRMYWGEHPPPHFHAVYGEEEATVDIRTFKLLRGSLPPRALQLTLHWAVLHHKELLENWIICARNQPPKAVLPLD